MKKKVRTWIPLLFLSACAIACRACAGGGDSETVYAPTGVGTPEGEKITKSIGAAGGTLSSPDGRLTLTVPQNALTEPLSFSIQPITNTAANGLGIAYRLEPNGTVFTTPLQVAFRYDENDITGTVPEALSVAYQDASGAWHVETSGTLDQITKTLTLPISHFTDYAMLARLRITPTEATVRVREAKIIQLLACAERTFVDKLLSRPLTCNNPPLGKMPWKLRGPGKLQESSLALEMGIVSIMYIAPNKRPTPNTAEVETSATFTVWNSNTGESTIIEKKFIAKITIIDRGFNVTGQDGTFKYSGVICSLDKPFTVMAANDLVQNAINFVPSSGTAGSLNYDTTWGAIRMSGNGTYTVDGPETEKPRIVAQTKSTATAMGRRTSGGGPAHIDLIPIEGDECGVEGK